MKNALTALVFPQKRLNKPIFLVGCAKSGTTMLGQIIFSHPEVGPKGLKLLKFNDLQDNLNGLAEPDIHASIAKKMEEKALWNKYFPMKNVYLTVGKEMILYSNPLSFIKTKMLINEISSSFLEERFFSKQPFNTFRIHVLRELFPEAKILAIHRDGRDVVSSWGKEVNRWEKLGGFDKGIPVFTRKWNEAVSHIEDHKGELGIYTFKYEDLIENPKTTLKKIFDFCELEFPVRIYDDLHLINQHGKWKKRIPEKFHPELNRLTSENLQRLGYAD